MRFTIDLSAAPEARKFREAQIRRDLKRARERTQAGAEARFRLQHGMLTEFLIAERARDAPLSHIVAGYGRNFEDAIVDIARNTKSPAKFAASFLERLAERVAQRLKVPDPDVGFALVDVHDGEIKDYDFRKALRK
jgi:hypothetical protein